FPLFLPTNDQYLTSAAMSADGRWIAYAYGSGKTDGIFESRISLFDRVFQSTQIAYSSTDETIVNLSLNNNGTLLSFRSRIGDDLSTGKYIDLSSNEFVSVNLPGSADFTTVIPALNQVISVKLKQGKSLTSLYDLNNNHSETVPINPINTHISTSDSGDHIVFIGSNENSSSVYLASRSPIPSGTSYSGQVNGAHGFPLGSVNVSIGDWDTRTDQKGLYFFEHIASDQDPQFTKDGYSFEINSVFEKHTSVFGFPEGVIEEARLDIGMPYSFDRGCSSPFDPCGGPYHGFFTG
ncbi:MAG: hypothetical protein GWN30_19895, partial [Gammaproteobacteria bacterium]|nr:hypothetical protein [Gammaproteobacteria bacterium]